MPQPLVSIIVPSFNQGQFVAESLDSILAQDYRPLEIIVMDGASTDNTVEVLKQYEHHPELTWVSEPDDGPVDAVNKALALAKGELVGIQSTDDIYLPGAVSASIAVLDSDPAISMVYSDAMKVDAEGKEIYQTELPEFTMEAFFAHALWLPQSTTFFRRQQAIDVGGWRQPMAYAADTDLWMRLAFLGRVVKIPGVYGTHRKHDQQRDTQNERVADAYIRMVDSCDALKDQPASVQQAAAAGKVLIRQRYYSGQKQYKGVRGNWKAVRIYPQVKQQIDWMGLVPFYVPTRVALSKVKHRVLGTTPKNQP